MLGLPLAYALTRHAYLPIRDLASRPPSAFSGMSSERAMLTRRLRELEPVIRIARPGALGRQAAELGA